MNSIGLTYYAKGLYDEAIMWYKKALDIKPNDIDAMNNLANSYKFSGNNEKALFFYKKVLEFESSFQSALFNLAGLYFETKQFNMALETINKLLSVNPDDNEAKLLKEKIEEQPKKENFATRLIRRNRPAGCDCAVPRGRPAS